MSRKKPKTQPAKKETGRPGFESKWLLTGLLCLWVLLNWSIYPPHEAWPLAYLCLVPWAVAVCGYKGRKWLLVNCYLWGVLFFFFCLNWLWNVAYVPIGKLRIPAGSAGIALYLSIFFPIIAWVVRHLYWHRRLGLVIVLPTVWVFSEFLRGALAGDFPWFTLAQSHYRQLAMIQISDLLGAYCVTFLIAMVNGLIADGIMLRWYRPTSPIRPRFSTAAISTVALLALTLVYGFYQLGRDTMSPGPRIATIQGNYVLEVDLGSKRPSPWEKRTKIMGFVEQAVEQQPDMIVLSESPWPMLLNAEYRRHESTPAPPGRDWSRACHRDFLRLVGQTGACLVTGAMSREFYPTAVYPRQASFNSAFVYAPGRPEPQRYDKVHLVVFGEYVPFRGGRFHQLYGWLNGITPWGQDGYEYSLTPGTEFTVFEMSPPSEPHQTYRFGIPICYEDVMPYVSRRFVIDSHGNKRADFLVNISNDGWFQRSSELVQHLALAVFRCVENRVGMVRSVNTGVSAFIKPSGEIYSPVQKDGRLRGEDLDGWSLDRVMTDSRVSLYSRWGDWFPALTSILTGLAFLDALWCRRRRRKEVELAERLQQETA